MLKRPPASRVAGVVGLTVGLLVALAGNLTYSWPHGSVMIGAGVICPGILPLALWIRSTFTVTAWLDKFIRDASVIAIAGPAAAFSYQHTYMLMRDQGVSPWLAALLPLSADGIAALSTLALHRSKVTAKARKVETRRRDVEVVKPAVVVPSPAPSEITDRSQQRAAMVMWAQKQSELPPLKKIQTEFRVSQSTAKRVRRDAAAMA